MKLLCLDSSCAVALLDAAAYLLMAAGLLAVFGIRRWRASIALERALCGLLLNAAALVLWNDLHDPVEAWSRWLAALPLLLACGLLPLAVGLDSRRYRRGASALLGLLWLYGPPR